MDREAKLIKVTIEFKSVDETIVALAKLVPPAPKKEMTNPDALKTVAELTTAGVPEKAPSVSSVAKQGAIPVAAPASDNTPTTRKGRADKGKPRGPRKNVAGTVTTASDSVAGAGTGQSAPSESPLAASTAAVPAAPETAAPVQSEEPKDKAPSSKPDAAALTPQQTIEAIYEKRGVEGAMQFLSRFGVKRVRELKPEQHAEFVKHGVAVLAGGEI